MYVCVCKALTEQQIRQAVHDEGHHSMRALGQSLGLARQCGKCHREARSLLEACLECPSEKTCRVAAHC